MKKSVIVIVFLINLGLVLSSCSKKADPIMLPSLNEISSIEIVNEGKSIIHSDKEWVESFIQKVNEAKPTSKKSIHDGPTVSEYTQVNLVATVILHILLFKQHVGCNQDNVLLF